MKPHDLCARQVRDVAQTIDAKEALHAQLLMTQQQ
jgi:hypothetical protein